MRESIDPIILSLTQDLSTTIDKLSLLTSHVNNSELHETLQQLKFQLASPFTFVIVGEVKAGKSSFVNALLGAKVSAASQAITTMDVQKIVYGDEEMLVKDAQKRIVLKEHPAKILKEITIVDTPGTNSRELDHQVVTEKFIPHCNLVVFIFQMDNIHVQSAWDFFKKIKDLAKTC